MTAPNVNSEVRRVGLTKSGLKRRVEMSRRLRQLLLERQMRAGRPDPTAWVDEDGYRNPLQVAPGELPTVLFARLDLWHATTAPPDATKIRNMPNLKSN